MGNVCCTYFDSSLSQTKQAEQVAGTKAVVDKVAGAGSVAGSVAGTGAGVADTGTSCPGTCTGKRSSKVVALTSSSNDSNEPPRTSSSLSSPSSSSLSPSSLSPSSLSPSSLSPSKSKTDTTTAIVPANTNATATAATIVPTSTTTNTNTNTTNENDDKTNHHHTSSSVSSSKKNSHRTKVVVLNVMLNTKKSKEEWWKEQRQQQQLQLQQQHVIENRNRAKDELRNDTKIVDVKGKVLKFNGSGVDTGADTCTGTKSSNENSAAMKVINKMDKKIDKKIDNTINDKKIDKMNTNNDVPCTSICPSASASANTNTNTNKRRRIAQSSSSSSSSSPPSSSLPSPSSSSSMDCSHNKSFDTDNIDSISHNSNNNKSTHDEGYIHEHKNLSNSSNISDDRDKDDVDIDVDDTYDIHSLATCSSTNSNNRIQKNTDECTTNKNKSNNNSNVIDQGREDSLSIASSKESTHYGHIGASVSSISSRTRSPNRSVSDNSSLFETLPRNLIKTGFIRQTASILRDERFIKGRIQELGADFASRVHVEDLELLFKREKRSRTAKKEREKEKDVKGGSGRMEAALFFPDGDDYFSVMMDSFDLFLKLILDLCGVVVEDSTEDIFEIDESGEELAEEIEKVSDEENDKKNNGSIGEHRKENNDDIEDSEKKAKVQRPEQSIPPLDGGKAILLLGTFIQSKEWINDALYYFRHALYLFLLEVDVDEPRLLDEVEDCDGTFYLDVATEGSQGSFSPAHEFLGITLTQMGQIHGTNLELNDSLRAYSASQVFWDAYLTNLEVAKKEECNETNNDDFDELGAYTPSVQGNHVGEVITSMGDVPAPLESFDEVISLQPRQSDMDTSTHSSATEITPMAGNYTVNSSAKTWEVDTLEMNEDRQFHGTVILSDNEILITGGWSDYHDGYLNSVQVVGINNKSATTVIPPLPLIRYGHASVVIGRYAYVVGGQAGNGSNLKSMERINFDTTQRLKQWESIADMNVARFLCAAAIHEDKIFVFGGEAENGNALPTVEYFDTKGTKDGWKVIHCRMETPRIYHAAVTVGDMIYIIGGEDNNHNTFNSVEIFDPSEQSFHEGPPLPIQLTQMSAVTVGTCIIVIGGYTADSQIIQESYLLDTTASNQVWQTIDLQLQTPRSRHNAVLMKKNKLCICGGEDDDGNFLNTIEIVLIPDPLPPSHDTAQKEESELKKESFTTFFIEKGQLKKEVAIDLANTIVDKDIKGIDAPEDLVEALKMYDEDEDKFSAEILGDDYGISTKLHQRLLVKALKNIEMQRNRLTA